MWKKLIEIIVQIAKRQVFTMPKSYTCKAAILNFRNGVGEKPPTFPLEIMTYMDLSVHFNSGS